MNYLIQYYNSGQIKPPAILVQNYPLKCIQSKVLTWHGPGIGFQEICRKNASSTILFHSKNHEPDLVSEQFHHLIRS